MAEDLQKQIDDLQKQLDTLKVKLKEQNQFEECTNLALYCPGGKELHVPYGVSLDRSTDGGYRSYHMVCTVLAKSVCRRCGAKMSVSIESPRY